MKTLWVISGGVEAIPTIRRARDQGLRVVVSDGNPEAPGFRYAHTAIVASTYDAEATVQAARQYTYENQRIDGVLCAAADVPVTVASVAQEFGLAGVSLETARLTTDKLAMKDQLRAVGIPIPFYRPIHSTLDLRQAVELSKHPLILKPVDSRGARGVLRLTGETDPDWAFNHARACSPTSRVMVEEYLEGPQISTETILVDGDASTPGFTDRNYEFLERFSPYVIENGGQSPSRLAEPDRAAVTDLVEEAARALGIHTGVAKGDMVLTQDGPKVIEIASRLSGGWFSSHQIPLGTGVDFLGAAIRLSLGEKVPAEELCPRFARGVSIRFFFPQAGRVTAIRNLDQFRSIPWLPILHLSVEVGDATAAMTDHTQRGGVVLATGRDREEAVARAENAVSTIEIETTHPQVEKGIFSDGRTSAACG